MIQNKHNKLNNTLNDKIQAHKFSSWLNHKGWKYYPYQIKVVEEYSKNQDILVIAPTGAGKTIAGFLPSILDVSSNNRSILHTLYISPLKSLAYDIERNLRIPFKDSKINITLDVRTGDTSAYKKKLLIEKPPNFLITTPESFALLMSYKNSRNYFSSLKCLIIDELHNIMHTKRGDLLTLNISRLNSFVPKLNKIALSATIKNKKNALDYISNKKKRIVIEYQRKKKYNLNILKSKNNIPWSGHLASYAITDIYKKISDKYCTVIFVNTRAQSEFLFKGLWDINYKKYKIAVHHGSLEKNIRKMIEKKIFDRTLDCIIATSTLELGIDFSSLGLVIQVGAPKGVSRMMQRIGRSNHNLKHSSNALLVPTNKFEYLECLAVIKAIEENDIEKIDSKEGSLDVLAQHILGVACSENFTIDDLYKMIKSSYPYKNLEKKKFIKLIKFVQNGGYSLKGYKQFIKIKKINKNNFTIIDDSIVKKYRMNIGTIVENQMLPIFCKSKKLGVIEEFFVQNLEPGDTFLFAGEVLKFLNINSKGVQTDKTKSKDPKIPSYIGGRLPLSTKLSDRVIQVINNYDKYRMPNQIVDWIKLQDKKSILPKKNSILVETFKRASINHIIIYSFEGKKINQTLGMLILKRLEKLNNRPIGFVTTDYAIAIKCLDRIESIKDLLSKDILFNNLSSWVNTTSLTKRHFRNIAIISGLIEKNLPGHIKTSKQITFNSDLIYEVLQKFEKNHILLEATELEVFEELIDFKRLTSFFSKAANNLNIKELKKVSPFSASLLLEFNSVSINSDKILSYSLDSEETNILKDASLIK